MTKNQPISYVRSYRGSSAPTALLCPGSVNIPSDEVQIETANPAATIGTVVHKICEHIVKFGCVPADWQDVCKQYGLDSSETKEVGSLIYAALSYWQENGDAFPNANPETPLAQEITLNSGEQIRLTTRLDVTAFTDDETEAFDLDWKTTRLDVDYTFQLLFGAWLISLTCPSVQKITTVIVFLRDRSVDIRVWTLDQINAFAERFIDRVVKWDRVTYTSGGHCGYCKRLANCPAHKALMRIVQGELVTTGDTGVDVFAPEQIVALHQRLKVFSAMVKMVEEHIRAEVAQTEDGLPDGNGKALKLVPENRDTIDPLKGWPVLSRELNQAELAGALRVSKTAAMDAIGKKAARGDKKAAKEAVMDELHKAGAVETKEIYKLRLVKDNVKEIAVDA